MQKNKFVHKNLRQSATVQLKKLVACGLVIATGAACTIGTSCRTVSAQTPTETNPQAQPAAIERQQRIDNLMQVRRQRRIARGSDRWTPERLDTQEALERQQIAEDPNHLNQLEDDEILYWGASPTIFGPDAEARHRNLDLIRELERQLESEQTLRRNAEERADALEWRQNQHIGEGTGGRQTITGNTMLQVRGTNHIEAWSDTHVHSISNNELMHEGSGGVDIDRGDIVISDFSNSQTIRDVTVNEANSVTVAPGISTHIQNGTEFTIGRTAQETLENLQRAMGLPLGRGSNAQRPQSSNCALKFIISVIVALWTFSFGTLFGGSGGSK